MRIEIFRVPPKAGEWAHAAAPYSFRPQRGDDEPVAVVEVPAGWLLVGEPEPLLVRRTSMSDFTTRSATEVFYHGIAKVEGFVAELVIAGETGEALVHTVTSELPSLPAPASRNGRKANLPARRGQP